MVARRVPSEKKWEVPKKCEDNFCKTDPIAGLMSSPTLPILSDAKLVPPQVPPPPPPAPLQQQHKNKVTFLKRFLYTLSAIFVALYGGHTWFEMNFPLFLKEYGVGDLGPGKGRHSSVTDGFVQILREAVVGGSSSTPGTPSTGAHGEAMDRFDGRALDGILDEVAAFRAACAEDGDQSSRGGGSLFPTIDDPPADMVPPPTLAGPTLAPGEGSPTRSLVSYPGSAPASPRSPPPRCHPASLRALRRETVAIVYGFLRVALERDGGLGLAPSGPALPTLLESFRKDKVESVSEEAEKAPENKVEELTRGFEGLSTMT